MSCVRISIALFLLTLPAVIHAQSWSDSLTSQEKFWSRSGGYARQIALGAGGFGMLADTGIKTLAVNPFSVDPLFMLQNPAYASHYPAYLWFDLGTPDPQSGGGIGEQFGGIFAVSDVFNAGIILARNDATGFSLVNPNLFRQISTLASIGTATPSNTWEVLGSLEAGSADIGLAISYSSSSASSGVIGEPDSNFHQLGLSGGVLLRGDNGLMFDLGASALLPSVSYGGGEVSSLALGVNARTFLPIGTTRRDPFYLVPIADVYFEKGTSTVIATPKDLSTSSNIDAGLGVNFWQGGLHVMSGVSFGYYVQQMPSIPSVSPELSKSQTIVPRFTIGAEWPLLKWLTARLGYFASNGSQTTDFIQTFDTKSSTTTGMANLYSPFAGTSQSGVSIGAGFYISRFTIDLGINTFVFHNGPTALFNNGDFEWVTMSYRFDGNG
jgi:hypothetical protein